MNKNEFMQILQKELQPLGISAVSEIMADFQEHFANGLASGKTEAEITAELGNPLEIAQQYKDGNAEKTARPATPKPSGNRLNVFGLVFVLVFNILIGIPLLIAVISTLFGFWAAAGGIGIAACALFAAAIVQAGIISLIFALFGLSLAALLVLAVLLMVYATKWLIIGIIHYVRWNKKLLVGGDAI